MRTHVRGGKIILLKNRGWVCNEVRKCSKVRNYGPLDGGRGESEMSGGGYISRVLFQSTRLS